MYFFFILKLVIRNDGFCPNATWNNQSIVVAGGYGAGYVLNQLNYLTGMYVDDDKAVYVADSYNSRIVKWLPGASNAELVVSSQQLQSEET